MTARRQDPVDVMLALVVYLPSPEGTQSAPFGRLPTVAPLWPPLVYMR
jgi:hypothetical protein